MYQIERVSILLFTSFLLLFFSILLILIRLMTTESYRGTLHWTGAFLFPMLIVIHILKNILNLYNVSFYFITVVFFISNLLLFGGWKRFYEDKSSYKFYITVISVFGILTFLYRYSSVNYELMIDAVNIMILLRLIIYLNHKYRKKHTYASGMVLALNISALFLRLLPFIVLYIQRKTLIYYRTLQLIEDLSFPAQISMLMLAIYLAIMHKFRVDYMVIINEKEKLLEKLEHQAITDPLTAAYNRRGFEKIINYEFLQNKRRDKGFTVVICDIDHFKKVNDTYGHECGDIVIKEAVNTISRCIREQDTLARWGGEEFIILMLNSTTEQASASVERIRSEIEKLEIEYKSNTVRFTMSFGISESSKNDENYDQIIARADQKLYRAKESGRNCIIC